MGQLALFFMNILIISTFSCKFEEFKNDVTNLFLEEMCKEFVTDYEFVKVNNHKSHLLMNCTDLEKLGAEMESPFAKEWDKKIIVKIPSIQFSLLIKSETLNYLNQFFIGR